MTQRPQISIPGYGVIEGVRSKTQPTVAKFLNIPFATVMERWRPAVKPAPWSGIRDGSALGPACPQPNNLNPLANLTNDPTVAALLSSLEYSERDCLNLNIFAPLDHLTKAQTLIPVMVWIHGGGFLSGSNAQPLYDGTNFVARSINIGRPIVLVTVNYRLNYLGFMASKEMVQDIRSIVTTQEQQGQISVGNWGLLDQKIALEWVQDHIHVFGGNSQDVTAFGESAGATSIAYHLILPAHHGLFQRAILQSGAVTTMAAGRAESEGQRYFEHLCKHFKLDSSVQDPALGRPLTGDEKMQRLKALTAEELVKAGDRGRVGMFLPTIDDVLIQVDVRSLIHDPSRYDPAIKSLMIGDCRDEGQVFVPVIGAKTLKRWDKFVQRYCPNTEEDRQEFDKIYGAPKTDKEARKISAEVLTDAVFLYPNYATSMALMKTRVQDKQPRKDPLEMVRFHFDRPLQLLADMGFPGLGAYHASELPYVFGSDSSLLILSEEEKRLSQRMMDLWILFAWGETSRQYGLGHGMQSLMPRDAPGCGGLWAEAVVFSDSCSVERGRVERMDERKVRFWERYEQWVRQRREDQHAARNKQAHSKL